MPEDDGKEKAWVQARVNEYGSITAAKPDGITHQAWRKLCRHYGVTSQKFGKANTLEQALEAVARLAES